jgi:hypothetical protein
MYKKAKYLIVKYVILFVHDWGYNQCCEGKYNKYTYILCVKKNMVSVNDLYLSRKKIWNLHLPYLSLNNIFTLTHGNCKKNNSSTLTLSIVNVFGKVNVSLPIIYP